MKRFEFWNPWFTLIMLAGLALVFAGGILPAAETGGPDGILAAVLSLLIGFAIAGGLLELASDARRARVARLTKSDEAS